MIALIFPLVVLAVPFLDTAFVVLKRIKYRRPVYVADANHFHHRMSQIGFSQRRTVLYLYGWTLVLAGFAVALRFVPYSDDGGNLNAGWTIVMARSALLVAGGERVPRLRARDPEVQAPARLAGARAPTRRRPSTRSTRRSSASSRPGEFDAIVLPER